MSAYGFLSDSYDRLTTDVQYEKWADYLERQFARAKRPIHTVLDLACGTGTLSCILARRGYEMISVDPSAEMLAVAAEKIQELENAEPPLLLCQSMEELDLYDTVDACVCCLDSVNHVTSKTALRMGFERVHLFLNPGGLFIFDINTPEKLMAMDGQVYLDETEEDFCVWRTEFDRRRQVCTFAMDVFRREGGLWQRGEELQEERAWTPQELEAMLAKAGFTQVRQYGERKFRRPKAGESRIFFTAGKDK